MAKIQTPCPWKVIDAPAEFWIGRAFAWRDVKLSAEFHVWPNGIVFENSKTNRRLIYWKGNLRDIHSLSESTARLN